MLDVVTIPYTPNKFQAEIHNDKHRYKIICWHRQAGKSTLAINEIIKRAFSIKGTYFYIAPTYRQAKMIAWDMIQNYLPAKLIAKKNENELSILLINGSKISLKGADSPDSLRGVSLNGVIMDEYATMNTNVWNEIIQPTLTRTDGWAIFIGTPRGKGHFYEMFKMGTRAEPNNWRSWQLSAHKSGILPQEELDEIKRNLPERLYQQEYMAEFQDDGGVVFNGVKFCVKGHLSYPDPSHEYVMGVDLGKADDFTVMTVIDKNMSHVVAFERINQRDWNLIKAKIEACARRYNTCLTRIDASGMESPIIEDLRRQGIEVDGFVYTASSKKQLIENLILLVDQQKISFPPIQELVDEMELFSFDISASGNIKYGAPHGFHDDCVNSLALACWDYEPSEQGKSGIYLPSSNLYT